jgi:putative membrane protein
MRPGRPSIMGNIQMQLANWYLWIKAMHIAFMVTWFAGLFYLPRLFIYHSDAAVEADRARFTVMEKRLFIIMTIGGLLTTVFGLLLLSVNPALVSQGWFQLKLLLLAGLFIYHWRCWLWIGRLASGQLPADTRWLRWFNELPVIFLLGMIGLAVVKPF